MDRGTLDFHRSMHDLVRADYLVLVCGAKRP
jgi:hypothetical protein